MFDTRSQTNDLLQSAEALKTEDPRHEPVGRDDEIETIVETLRPISKKQPAEDLLVYGPAGVGKTTCIKHVLDGLERRTSVKAVYINCWQYNTRSSLLTELLIRLGYPAPRKGKPVDELLDKVREWVEKNRGVAVVLDEFDKLEDRTEIVYDLQLVDDRVDNQLAGVYVANCPPSEIAMEDRSYSRLCSQTLHFGRYSAEELQVILKARGEQAFRSGALSDEVVERIAEVVSESNGDCRKALEYLLRAGRAAERQSAREVTVDHLPVEGVADQAE